MEEISDYVLRLLCGAIICGLILSITGVSGATGRILKLMCSLFLVFLAISPLRQIDLEELVVPASWLQSEAEQLAQDGQSQAENAFCELITEQVCAYILSKAVSLGVDIQAEVVLDPETHAPAEVTLIGDVTPYEKNMLTELLYQDLGIERSSIHWNP